MDSANLTHVENLATFSGTIEDSRRTETPIASPPSITHTESEAIAVVSEANASESSPSGLRPSLTGQTSFQRPKKRVIWRNRGIIISLPINSEYGKNPSRDHYFSPAEVAQRLDIWVRQGYNTTGFVLAPASAGDWLASEGRSRAVYPNPDDEKKGRNKGSYEVNIPDPREWDTYVTQLKEEKLRALGVSSGEEEYRRKSPAPSSMSRQESSQSSGVLKSPSLAPSSTHAAQLPPQFPGTESFASYLGKPAVSHFPRYSMAMPGGETAVTSSSQHFQPSQPPLTGTVSPKMHLGSQPGSGIASPSFSRPIQIQGNSALFVQPVSHTSIDPISIQEPNNMLNQMHLQQALTQAQQFQQHQQQQTLQSRISLHDDLDQNFQSNVLETKAETSSALSCEPHRSPTAVTGDEVEESDAIIQDPGQSLKRDMAQNPVKVDTSHEPFQKNPISSVTIENESTGEETKSSNQDTDLDILYTPGRRFSHPGQFPIANSSNKSVSKLNVNAPEFKLDPKKRAGSGMFAFLGNQTSTDTTSYQSPAVPAQLSQPSQTTDITPHVSKFNVDAPAFVPAAARKPTIPLREFSFSTSGPSFEADALASRADVSGTPFTGGDSNIENPTENVQKIFGEINLAETTMSTKKSKAIPIVKPLKALQSPGGLAMNIVEVDGQEDESGRITQADGRQKRLRRDLDDGDQIPLFASHSRMPWMKQGGDDRAAHCSRTPSPVNERADPSTLDAATELLEEIIDDLSATEASDLMREDVSVAGDGKSFEAHSFHYIDEAASFNNARPLVPSRPKSASKPDPTPDQITEATINFLGKSPQFRSSINEALDGHSLDFQSPPSNLGVKESQHTNGLLHQHGVDRIDHARQDIMDGVRYIEPSYHEIDAVMRHLNADLCPEQQQGPFRQGLGAHSTEPPLNYSHDKSAPQQIPRPTNIRSDAPSPSPNRFPQAIQYLSQTDSESANTSTVERLARNARDVQELARFSPSYRPSKTSPPIHHLNSPGSNSPSDWDDVISSMDEDKLRSKTSFFDGRINELMGDVVQRRLEPLEQMLSGIQYSLATLSNRSTSRRPRSSGTLGVEHSDADDEHDTDDLSQPKSNPLARDRRYDQLKSSLNEITIAQQNFASASQLAEVTDIVKDLKASVQKAASGPATSSDFKAAIEDVLSKQMRGRSVPVTSTSQAAAAEKSQLQIAGLESMLKIAEARAEDELKARRATEDALADNQRLLRQALQEAAEQRESAEATERSLGEYSEERQQVLQRTAMLEGNKEILEKTISDMADKNAALEDTLAEYRLSSDQWRSDVDDARHENKGLKRSVETLTGEINESIQNRQIHQAKFDHLQEEMAKASQDVILDQSKWRGKEAEYSTRLDRLGTQLEAEVRTREELELDIERLEEQQKEAANIKFIVEETQKENTQLEDIVAKLKIQSHQHQQEAAHFERETNEAKESARIELLNVQRAMKADVEAANNQVNALRIDHEAAIASLHEQIARLTADADLVRTRHKIMLEEASTSRNIALEEAADARETASQEQYRFHERTIAELKAQYERAMSNALEDRQRSETFFGNRLNLADEKVVHYQDKIKHLEEKVEIARSAAHAAVRAAQSKSTIRDPTIKRTYQTIANVEEVPEKISPQALRESILVLQEQLQEREGRIEQLQSELGAFDTTAPTRLKDAETEITWLRELLGVRIDELEGIIAGLSHSNYDRAAVRDAAIRLRANLQMEQQEKERALAGGQSFPSLASITNLAASPKKALPLAAAAAWGNWRTSGFGNLSNITSGSFSRTPSKSSTSPQSFFAGLMTPPSTQVRTTPPMRHPEPAPPFSEPRIKMPSTSRQNQSPSNKDRLLRSRQEPVTPPLMTMASYDLDARESLEYSGEVAERVKGEDEEEQPFGPRLGGIVEGM